MIKYSGKPKLHDVKKIIKDNGEKIILQLIANIIEHDSEKNADKIVQDISDFDGFSE
jgi:hypothetical protein